MRAAAMLLSLQEPHSVTLYACATLTAARGLALAGAKQLCSLRHAYSWGRCQAAHEDACLLTGSGLQQKRRMN